MFPQILENQILEQGKKYNKLSRNTARRESDYGLLCRIMGVEVCTSVDFPSFLWGRCWDGAEYVGDNERNPPIFR